MPKWGIQILPILGEQQSRAVVSTDPRWRSSQTRAPPDPDELTATAGVSQNARPLRAGG